MIEIKTKVQIIEETAAFYNLSNRAHINNKCFYYNKDSTNRCAVGRYLNDDVAFSKDEQESRASDIFKSQGFDILKEEYRIEDTSFWNRLQSFHDNADNWNSTGLSLEGENYKNELIKQYND